MFFDSRLLEAETTLEADICIIGAGPAGITLAKELAGSPIKVCLLESGSLDFDESLQTLNQSMEPVGDQIYPCPTGYPPGDTLRRRQLGGTSNAWMGTLVRYIPLEEIDFETRDWVPNSGWPFRKSDLDPYYERAQDICQIGPYAYHPEPWETEDSHPIDFGDRLQTRMFQFGINKPFTADAKKWLQTAENVSTYLYASVFELELDETSNTIRRAKILTSNGKPLWMSAKQFVLACGGIENPRILMMSNQTRPEGLGNQYDLVGRYLMDHPCVRLGHLFIPSRRTIRDMNFYGMRLFDNCEVQAKPILTREVMEQEKLLNMNVFFAPRPAHYRFNLLRSLFPKGKNYVAKSVSSGIQLSRSLKRGKFNGQALKLLKETLSGLDDAIYFQARKFFPFDIGWGWQDRDVAEKKYGLFAVYGFTEQPPYFNNRVALGNEKDRFGYPKVQVHWHWGQEARKSILRAQEIFKEDIEKAGLGTLKLELDKGDPQLAKASLHHPMGTTRMHEDPKKGVVDANCQVHGVGNLFIAGSSVFPTGGFSNPTLTIVAISVRLADHLKTRMCSNITIERV